MCVCICIYIYIYIYCVCVCVVATAPPANDIDLSAPLFSDVMVPIRADSFGKPRIRMSEK